MTEEYMNEMLEHGTAADIPSLIGKIVKLESESMPKHEIVNMIKRHQIVVIGHDKCECFSCLWNIGLEDLVQCVGDYHG
jgi:hypothetical protein